MAETKKRGGARPGAGRKSGGVNKKTREIAEKAIEAGLTPLEVMLEAMGEAYNTGGAVAAFPFAKDAAPYMHAKIQAMELTGKDGGPVQTEEVGSGFGSLAELVKAGMTEAAKKA